MQLLVDKPYILKDIKTMMHLSLFSIWVVACLSKEGMNCTFRTLTKTNTSTWFCRIKNKTFLRASSGFFRLKESELPTFFHASSFSLHRSVEQRERKKKIIRRRQSCPETLDGSKTYCTLILIGMQRLHSFIMVRFHTPPQVILNPAIHQLHLPNPCFPQL